MVSQSAWLRSWPLSVPRNMKACPKMGPKATFPNRKVLAKEDVILTPGTRKTIKQTMVEIPHPSTKPNNPHQHNKLLY